MENPTIDNITQRINARIDQLKKNWSNVYSEKVRILSESLVKSLPKQLSETELTSAVEGAISKAEQIIKSGGFSQPGSQRRFRFGGGLRATISRSVANTITQQFSSMVENVATDTSSTIMQGVLNNSVPAASTTSNASSSKNKAYPTGTAVKSVMLDLKGVAKGDDQTYAQYRESLLNEGLARMKTVENLATNNSKTLDVSIANEKLRIAIYEYVSKLEAAANRLASSGNAPGAGFSSRRFIKDYLAGGITSGNTPINRDQLDALLSRGGADIASAFNPRNTPLTPAQATKLVRAQADLSDAIRKRVAQYNEEIAKAREDQARIAAANQRLYESIVQKTVSSYAKTKIEAIDVAYREQVARGVANPQRDTLDFSRGELNDLRTAAQRGIAGAGKPLPSDAEIDQMINDNITGIQQRYLEVLARIQREANIKSLAEERKANDERLAEERAAQEQENRFRGAQQKYPQAFAKVMQRDPSFLLDEFGQVDVNKLQSIRTEASTGISQLTFGKTGEWGEAEKMTVTLDRLGNVLDDTSRRFRGFFSSVGREMVEFTKWSLAIAAIYTPLQKMQELISTAIENEAKLADVAITLGGAQVDLNKIFESSVKVANETSVAVGGVVDGYNLAFRSTASIKDETTRFVAANTLLKDSLILSKLAGIDQAQSTDILVAALSQSNRGLTEGTSLLDKWVKTSNKANVDVSTLATTFAVVGEIAENAAISFEELNAIVATVASTGITSPKETANAVRALISGMGTDQAKTKLREFGIAVEDVTTGQMRPFLEISKDIAERFDKGLISASQLSDIGMAIGGGNRRGPMVTTFLSNYGNIQGLVEEQSKANGEAQKALAIEFGTVASAATRADNAFQSLAQALGQQGGLLNASKDLLNAISGITEGLSELVKISGSASLGILFSGIAGLVSLGKKSNITSALGSAIEKIPGFAASVPNQLDATDIRLQKMAEARAIEDEVLRSAAIRKVRMADEAGLTNVANAQNKEIISASALEKAGTWYGSAVSTAILAGFSNGLPAIMAARKGDMESMWTNIFGGAIGIALGAATQNPGVGLLGGAIATSILEGLIEGWKNATEFREVGGKENLADTFKKLTGKPPEPPDIAQKQQSLSEKLLRKGATALSDKDVKNLLQNPSYEPQSPQYFFNKFRNDPEGVLKMVEELRKAGLNAMADSIIADLNDASTVTGSSALAQKSVSKVNAVMYEVMMASMRSQLSSEFYNPAKGMSGAEYARRMQAIPAFSSFASGLESAAGYKDYDTIQTVFTKGTKEQQDDINSLVANIQKLKDEYKEATSSVEAATKYTKENGKSVEDLKAQLDALIGTVVPVMETYKKQIAMTNVQVPGLQNFEEITKSQFETVKQLAQVAEDAYQGMMNEEQRMNRQTLNSQEEFIVRLKDGYEKLKGVPADMLSYGMDQYEKKFGDLKNIGIRSLDVNPEQVPEIFSQYDVLKQKLVGMGYTPNEEGSIVSLNSNQQKQLYLDYWKKDFSIIQLILQQIADTEKKQLDGMYNLPEGAGFYVPLSAAQIRPKSSPIDLSQFGVTTGPGMVEKQLTDLRVGESALEKRMLDVFSPANIWEDMRPRGTSTNWIEQQDVMSELEKYRSQYPSDLGYDFSAVNESRMRDQTLQADKQTKANLNLQINATTNITAEIDGQVLVNKLMSYIADALVKFDNTAGSSATLSLIM